MRFADEDIERFWSDPVANPPRRVPPNARKALYRKLQMLAAACKLNDLRVPPGNRLEALKGKRKGSTAYG
jgi:proteic killer suppression protein